jgi:hypothetical protein
MMEFIIMTLSFTTAILLASLIGFMIMFNKKVMKMYAKHVVKCMSDFEELLETELEKGQ